MTDDEIAALRVGDLLRYENDHVVAVYLVERVGTSRDRFWTLACVEWSDPAYPGAMLDDPNYGSSRFGATPIQLRQMTLLTRYGF